MKIKNNVQNAIHYAHIAKEVNKMNVQLVSKNIICLKIQEDQFVFLNVLLIIFNKHQSKYVNNAQK